MSHAPAHHCRPRCGLHLFTCRADRHVLPPRPGISHHIRVSRYVSQQLVPTLAQLKRTLTPQRCYCTRETGRDVARFRPDPGEKGLETALQRLQTPYLRIACRDQHPASSTTRRGTRPACRPNHPSNPQRNRATSARTRRNTMLLPNLTQRNARASTKLPKRAMPVLSPHRRAPKPSSMGSWTSTSS